MVSRERTEHLRHEALILIHEDLFAIRCRNTGALLAAVLQGVEGEVGQAGNVLARGPYSEDPAVIVRVIVSDMQRNVKASTKKWDANGRDTTSSTALARVIGLVTTTLIYLFVMSYGMMVIKPRIFGNIR